MGNSRGYHTVIVIPQTQSQEKKDALRLYGAELREVPAVQYSNPDNYVHVAERLTAELARSKPNGVLYAMQWDNLSNRDGPARSIGPEIWRQTRAPSTPSSARSAPARTLAGVGLYLKQRKPGIRIAAAGPLGAAMYHCIKHGELRAEGSSIIEGIGQTSITQDLKGAPLDDAFQVADDEALPVLFDLLREEGLCLGGSSGVNVAGAIRLARELGPGHTIVTILADAATRYQSKLYNPVFLREKKLPVPAWLG